MYVDVECEGGVVFFCGYVGEDVVYVVVFGEFG